MKRPVVSCLFYALLLGLLTVSARGALVPPSGPQHQLSITIDQDGKQTIVKNTDALNYYDPITYHAYLENEKVPNPVKHAWMYLKFYVPSGSVWDPDDPNSVWGTLSSFGTVKLTDKKAERSGSSTQFLEIWQTWDVFPNPSSEDFYLNGFFVGDANTRLQLQALDIRTECVPEPTALVVAVLLLSPFGVAALRKSKPNRAASPE